MARWMLSANNNEISLCCSGDKAQSQWLKHRPESYFRGRLPGRPARRQLYLLALGVPSRARGNVYPNASAQDCTRMLRLIVTFDI